MYYFVEENGLVKKYFVNYDEMKILELRENLIKKYDNIILNKNKDKHQYPYLIKLIDRFIHGDDTSINEVFGFVGVDSFDGKNSLDEDIDEAIDNIKNNDLSKQIENCQNLIKLLEQKKKILEIINIEKYYIKLQDLIDFELIDEINKKHFEEMISFLNIEFKSNKTDSFKRKIKSLIC